MSQNTISASFRESRISSSSPKITRISIKDNFYKIWRYYIIKTNNNKRIYIQYKWKLWYIGSVHIATYNIWMSISILFFVLFYFIFVDYYFKCIACRDMVVHRPGLRDKMIHQVKAIFSFSFHLWPSPVSPYSGGHGITVFLSSSIYL